MAGIAKELDRCEVKHEIVALILIGIRGTEQKRLSGVIDRHDSRSSAWQGKG